MKTIFLVDDDLVFLKLLEAEFLQLGEYEIQTFSTGEKCIAHLFSNPDAVILDFHLDGIEFQAMDGIKTLDLIKAHNSTIAVIMLSSQDKIDVAVECMHHKADDYIVKSETAFFRIQKTLSAIFELQKVVKNLKWYKDRM